MFGKHFWKKTIIEITFWPHDKRSKRRRKKTRRDEESGRKGSYSFSRDKLFDFSFLQFSILSLRRIKRPISYRRLWDRILRGFFKNKNPKNE